MDKLYCKYCSGEIEGKGFTADNHRYHLKCLRIFRKKIDKQKQLGKIKVGQENQVNIKDLD